MNERIKELAVQADNYAYKMNPEQDSWGRVAYPKKLQQDRDAKFSELIVQECIKLNGKELAMAGHSRMVEVYCEHFGIEL